MDKETFTHRWNLKYINYFDFKFYFTVAKSWPDKGLYTLNSDNSLTVHSKHWMIVHPKRGGINKIIDKGPSNYMLLSMQIDKGEQWEPLYRCKPHMELWLFQVSESPLSCCTPPNYCRRLLAMVHFLQCIAPLLDLFPHHLNLHCTKLQNNTLRTELSS